MVEENIKFEKPAPGKLLISDPFLSDPNFNRTVVFLTEHKAEGSVGFVLNKPMDLKLDEVVDFEVQQTIPLYMGGPVQQDTLHILHQNQEVADPNLQVINGVYWGANFEAVKIMLENGAINNEAFRFYLGYSGWGEGQLEREIEEKSWIVTKATPQIVFSNDAETMWKEVMKEMGGKYSYLANSPDNPQWN